MGAVVAPTRFSLVRISVRDLVADGKSLVRNSGVGGGGCNLILIITFRITKAKVVFGVKYLYENECERSSVPININTRAKATKYVGGDSFYFSFAWQRYAWRTPPPTSMTCSRVELRPKSFFYNIDSEEARD